MNSRILFVITLFFLFSCNKDKITEVLSPEISFEVSKFIETENPTFFIELTPNGYYYFSYRINRIFYTSFAGDTSSFETESEVLSLVYNKRFRQLYFGTRSSGLGLFNGNEIKYFTQENSILPRNLIGKMDIDGDGYLWVCSSNNGAGGLYRFDGKDFIHFSTENSPLTSDLISGICCWNTSVYISGNGANGKTVFRIDKKENDEYSWENILSDGEYHHEIAVDKSGNVYVIFGIPAEGILKLSADGTKKIITPEREASDFVYTKLKTDKRGYLWANKISLVSSENFSVFDGENWHPAPSGFPENGLESVDVDENNNIWLASYSGIYVLNQ